MFCVEIGNCWAHKAHTHTYTTTSFSIVEQKERKKMEQRSKFGGKLWIFYTEPGKGERNKTSNYGNKKSDRTKWEILTLQTNDNNNNGKLEENRWKKMMNFFSRKKNNKSTHFKYPTNVEYTDIRFFSFDS